MARTEVGGGVGEKVNVIRNRAWLPRHCSFFFFFSFSFFFFFYQHLPTGLGVLRYFGAHIVSGCRVTRRWPPMTVGFPACGIGLPAHSPLAAA